MFNEPREALAGPSTFKLTPGPPDQIDLTTVYKDKPNPLHTEGIYCIEEDVLTYCVAPPDRSRPVEFATNKGDGYTLVVLKRLSPELTKQTGKLSGSTGGHLLGVPENDAK